MSLPPQYGPSEARRVGFTLARYRERYYVALDTLAEWSGMAVERLMAFEGGRELPTPDEIERLVNAFTRVGENSGLDVGTMRAELLGRGRSRRQRAQ